MGNLILPSNQKDASKRGTTLPSYMKYMIVILGIGVAVFFTTYSGDNDMRMRNIPAYSKSDITNNLDNGIRKQLDEANTAFQKGNVKQAMQMYTSLLSDYPMSPRASFGLAECYQALAETQGLSGGSERAIALLNSTFFLPNLKPALSELVAKFLCNIHHQRAMKDANTQTLWEKIVERHPDILEALRCYSIFLYLSGMKKEAMPFLKKVVDRDPSDPLLGGWLGLIYFTETKIDLAQKYLQQAVDVGFKPNTPGVDRFYVNLVWCYNRLGDHEMEKKIVKECIKRGYIISDEQRSIKNVANLTARPWWTLEQSTYKQQLLKLENNWEIIRDETMALVHEESGTFKHESSGLMDGGEWTFLNLYRNKIRHDANCRRVPRTCALIEEFRACVDCIRCQVKLSVLQPGSHISAHSGPTNCKLRAHLGLKIPDGSAITVGGETRNIYIKTKCNTAYLQPETYTLKSSYSTDSAKPKCTCKKEKLISCIVSRTWTEGKILIFDDSFVHEVWHNGTSIRVILIVDAWHPDLTEVQKREMKTTMADD